MNMHCCTFIQRNNIRDISWMKINPLDQCNGKKFRANEKINQRKFKDFQILLQIEIRGKVLSHHWDCPVCLRDLNPPQVHSTCPECGQRKHHTAPAAPTSGLGSLSSCPAVKIKALHQRNKIKTWQSRAFLKILCTCAKGTSLLVSFQTGAQSKQEEGQKAEALAQSPSRIL